MAKQVTDRDVMHTSATANVPVDSLTLSVSQMPQTGINLFSTELELTFQFHHFTCCLKTILGRASHDLFSSSEFQSEEAEENSCHMPSSSSSEIDTILGMVSW